MSDFKNKTVQGVAWSVFIQIGKQILGFIVSVILARLLTPEKFGLIGMITVFSGFALLFNELGFGAALIQNQEVEEQHYSSIFWLNMGTGIILMFLLMLCAPLISQFYNEPQLYPLTLLISFNFFLGALFIVQKALLIKALAFKKLAIIELIALSTSGSVAIFLAFEGYGAYALVWQILIHTTISFIVTWKVSNWRPKFLFKWKAVKDLLRFSTNFLGSQVLLYWIRNGDYLLIGKFVGSAGLGIYTRAYHTMQLPISQVSNVLSRVMFPALSKIQDDKLRIKSIYLRAIGAIALFTFPMMLGLLVVSDTFVLAIYGSKWKDVIPILQIFCFIGLYQSIATTTGWIYTSQGRTDWLLKWVMAGGILTFIAFAIGIQWGVIGITIAYSIRVYLSAYYNFSIPGKLIDLTFGDVINTVKSTFICGCIMAILVWMVKFVLPTGLDHWMYLIIQILIGVFAYLILIRIFKIEAYSDIKKIISEQFNLKWAKYI